MTANVCYALGVGIGHHVRQALSGQANRPKSRPVNNLRPLQFPDPTPYLDGPATTDNEPQYKPNELTSQEKCKVCDCNLYRTKDFCTTHLSIAKQIRAIKPEINENELIRLIIRYKKWRNPYK